MKILNLKSVLIKPTSQISDHRLRVMLGED